MHHRLPWLTEQHSLLNYYECNGLYKNHKLTDFLKKKKKLKILVIPSSASLFLSELEKTSHTLHYSDIDKTIIKHMKVGTARKKNITFKLKDITKKNETKYDVIIIPRCAIHMFPAEKIDSIAKFCINSLKKPGIIACEHIEDKYFTNTRTQNISDAKNKTKTKYKIIKKNQHIIKLNKTTYRNRIIIEKSFYNLHSISFINFRQELEKKTKLTTLYEWDVEQNRRGIINDTIKFTVLQSE
ncbi:MULTISPECIES: hypothetical protein [Serratia]|uniref:hypothetical protein n=1 Tax=Serratia TaxID=613 RepID=UPI00066184F5|nr:hypothetical protein [Serratia sp. 506_PEND]